MDSKTIDSRWNFSDPAASENAFRELADEVDGEVCLQVQTQVVRALGLQRKFDDGHEMLDEIEAAASEPLTKVRVALERGRLLNSAGDLQAARPHFETALKIADEAGEEFYAVDAAHMLGIVNPPDEQLEWSLEALLRAEAATSERARSWLGSLYNNIGWSLHELARHHEALDMFEKAVEWHEHAAKEPGLRIARWTVARQLRELGEVEAALAKQRAILAEYTDEVSGYVYEELGECLLALGQSHKARPHFAKAYEMLSADSWMVANDAERLERLKTLGE
jgi:tetratricopeptide (TPR) repeat protein